MEQLLTRRQLKIINILSTKANWTAAIIAKNMKVSTKTIRNEVSRINPIIKEYNFQINSFSGKGLILSQIIEDGSNSNIDNLMSAFSFKSQVENSADRSHYIIMDLLLSDDYTKIDDLAERYFVDRTTISKDLKYIKSCLNEFDLELIQKPYNGIKISKNELKNRLCLVEYGFYKTSYLQNKMFEIYNELKNEIIKILDNDGISISNSSYLAFVQYITAAIYQINRTSFIDVNSDIKLNLESKYELLVAKDISKLLKSMVRTHYPDDEIYSIAMQLSSLKSNSIIELQSCIDEEAQPKIVIEVTEMLNHAKNIFGIDLTQDTYLIKLLNIHYGQMLIRKRYGIVQRNELIHDIIHKYSMSYLISAEVLRYLGSKYNRAWNEHEASFLAIHFEYAISRKFEYIKRTVLIIDQTTISVELIRYQIQSKIGKSIEIKNVINSKNLSQINFDEIDLIITTQKLIEKVPVEVIEIPSVLVKSDIDNLSEQIKPSQKVIDIQFSKVKQIEIDSFSELLITNENSIENEYYLDPLILKDSLLVKVILTDKRTSIEIISLDKPFVYRSSYIDEVAIIYTNKRKIRRVLRYLHKELNIV